MGARLQGEEKSSYVQNMFGRIAERYNLLNRLMTLGQDQRWRRFVVKQGRIPETGAVLDLATGTGDIAFEVVSSHPNVHVVGADFALPMMFVGQRDSRGERVQWCAADAMQLPFPDGTFDAVLSGYLVRNVIDIQQTLREQVRVLREGGRIVILDTTPPRGLLRPFILAYLKFGIPLLGRLVAGRNAADAYRCLPESTQAFKTPEELAELMKAAGMENVGYRTFMLGTMAVHWGEKPTRPTR